MNINLAKTSNWIQNRKRYWLNYLHSKVETIGSRIHVWNIWLQLVLLQCLKPCLRDAWYLIFIDICCEIFNHFGPSRLFVQRAHLLDFKLQHCITNHFVILQFTSAAWGFEVVIGIWQISMWEQGNGVYKTFWARIILPATGQFACGLLTM